MNTPTKWVGCCSLCGEECFEIRTRWPATHPLAGRPRNVSRPMAGTHRVSLAMTNGSRVDLTFCGECHPTPSNLPVIWHQCREAMLWEEHNRGLIGAGPLDLRAQWVHGKMHYDLAHEAPIGILASEPWQEVAARG